MLDFFRGQRTFHGTNDPINGLAFVARNPRDGASILIMCGSRGAAWEALTECHHKGFDVIRITDAVGRSPLLSDPVQRGQDAQLVQTFAAFP